MQSQSSLLCAGAVDISRLINLPTEPSKEPLHPIPKGHTEPQDSGENRADHEQDGPHKVRHQMPERAQHVSPVVPQTAGSWPLQRTTGKTGYRANLSSVSERVHMRNTDRHRARFARERNLRKGRRCRGCSNSTIEAQVVLVTLDSPRGLSGSSPGSRAKFSANSCRGMTDKIGDANSGHSGRAIAGVPAGATLAFPTIRNIRRPFR